MSVCLSGCIPQTLLEKMTHYVFVNVFILRNLVYQYLLALFFYEKGV